MEVEEHLLVERKKDRKEEEEELEAVEEVLEVEGGEGDVMLSAGELV